MKGVSTTCHRGTTMKMGCSPYSFFISSLDGGEWSVSPWSYFAPGKGPSVPTRRGGIVPRARRNILFPVGDQTQSPVDRLGCSRLLMKSSSKCSKTRNRSSFLVRYWELLIVLWETRYNASWQLFCSWFVLTVCLVSWVPKQWRWIRDSYETLNLFTIPRIIFYQFLATCLYYPSFFCTGKPLSSNRILWIHSIFIH